eukprot:TRINITY_DN24373_c0_g1_i1.p1 TRINITY_DN24373_c0_g1~~TRINITY_DN24373_c0_g1_i1.p1  ORF type:complete len:105 (-),score=4.09 TRINITY_DN24373_c0_g1_i1:2-280(-)
MQFFFHFFFSQKEENGIIEISPRRTNRSLVPLLQDISHQEGQERYPKQYSTDSNMFASHTRQSQGEKVNTVPPKNIYPAFSHMRSPSPNRRV